MTDSHRTTEARDVLVQRLRNAAQAYPVDMFPEVTPDERKWLQVERRGLQDRIAASMGRHMSSLLTAAADALERAAPEPAAEPAGLPAFYTVTKCSQCGHERDRIEREGCPESCGRTTLTKRGGE